MFIAPKDQNQVSSLGANSIDELNYIALLKELRCLKGREVYKHFTPGGVKSVPRRDSIIPEFHNRRQHIRALRQDCIFQLRRVGNEAVERGDATNGGVEVFK